MELYTKRYNHLKMIATETTSLLFLDSKQKNFSSIHLMRSAISTDYTFNLHWLNTLTPNLGNHFIQINLCTVLTNLCHANNPCAMPYLCHANNPCAMPTITPQHCYQYNCNTNNYNSNITENNNLPLWSCWQLLRNFYAMVTTSTNTMHKYLPHLHIYFQSPPLETSQLPCMHKYLPLWQQKQRVLPLKLNSPWISGNWEWIGKAYPLLYSLPL